MKIFAIVLFVVMLLLQFRLWVSEDGVREVRRLDVAVAAQQEENAGLKARNEQLGAEVKDLKEGLEAIEERARSDLGMIGPNETFHQVIVPEQTPADQPAVEQFELGPPPARPAPAGKAAGAP